jgi:tetratricopeptide (TPR) repeat protein
MNKIIFVVFNLLFTSGCFADAMVNTLQKIESEWALAEHTYPENNRKTAFQSLLKQTAKVANKFPSKAEPLILQACIILTRAKIENPMNALSSVHKAKNLLEKAITIDPHANQGSAMVTLGVLYYKVPSWPIAFGNNEKAKKMLENALRINPKGIDSNYFYAEFLIEQEKSEQATAFLVKALNAPIHATNELFARDILAKAKRALKNISTVIAYNELEVL